MNIESSMVQKETEAMDVESEQKLYRRGNQRLNSVNRTEYHKLNNKG